MKKMALVVMTVLGLAGAARADHGWGVYGSYFAPGNWDPAAGVGGKLSIEIVPHALLDLRGTWFQDFEKTEGASTTQLEVMPVDVGLSIVAGTKPVDVYVTGGMSFYSMDGSVYEGGRKQQVKFEDETGFYGGLGLEVTLNDNPAAQGATRVTFFVEGLYRYFAVDEMSAVVGSYPGGDVDGVNVNAGFMIRW